MGLLVGKQVGVIGSIWAATRIGVGTLPEGTDWLQLYGLALLTGIGFTMSLFIGTLAFPAEVYDLDVRIAVLLASVISAIAGYLVLRIGSQKRLPRSDPGRPMIRSDFRRDRDHAERAKARMRQR